MSPIEEPAFENLERRFKNLAEMRLDIFPSNSCSSLNPQSVVKQINIHNKQEDVIMTFK